MRKNIFVAIDFNSLEKAIDVTRKIKDQIAGVKIGTELYAVSGPAGIKKFKEELGLEVFLDLKLGPEIPNQVKKTVAAIASLKSVKYLTVHISGDYEMLKAAQEAAGSIELLGVTVLTSQTDLQNIGIKNSVKDQVKLLLNLAIKSGIAGVIASPQDIKLIRSLSRNLKIFCDDREIRASSFSQSKLRCNKMETLSFEKNSFHLVEC